MQRTSTISAVAMLAAVTLGCDQDLTEATGTFRVQASRTVTGAQIAEEANRPLPYVVQPGYVFEFEGPFEDPPEEAEAPIERLHNAQAQLRFETNLEIGAIVHVIMTAGTRRCTIAEHLRTDKKGRGVSPVHWTPQCKDILFSPDRVVTVRVESTNEEEVVIEGDDYLTVSVRATFRVK